MVLLMNPKAFRMLKVCLVCMLILLARKYWFWIWGLLTSIFGKRKCHLKIGKLELNSLIWIVFVLSLICRKDIITLIFEWAPEIFRLFNRGKVLCEHSCSIRPELCPFLLSALEKWFALGAIMALCFCMTVGYTF